MQNGCIGRPTWLRSPHSARKVSTKASRKTGENSRLSMPLSLVSPSPFRFPFDPDFTALLPSSFSTSSYSDAPS